MTRKDALNFAIAHIDNEEVKETLSNILASVTRTRSDEAKANANAKRKEATAIARAELVAKVAPIIRNAMSTEPLTAKEIFAKCEGLPSDFSVAKVQNVLLRELANEVVKVEAKGKANTYALAE